MTQEPLVALPIQQFAEAARDLVDPKPEWYENRFRYADSIYTRLRGSLTAATAKGSGVSKSRLPCRVEVLSLLTVIDGTVAAWWPDAATTADRLTKMAEHPWAPEHREKLDDYITQLEQWTTAGQELLGDKTVSVPLRKPCPRCERLWAYRKAGNETIRAYALTASENGAACSACHATWTTDDYPFLARLLNGDPDATA